MEALSKALEGRGLVTDLRPVEPPIESSLVVMDSYEYRADDPKICRGGVVAAVDDLDRDLEVALLIEPLQTDPLKRRAMKPLTGLAYALIDPDLSIFDQGVVGPEPITSILVTTGASDAAGIGAGIAASLVRRFSRVEIALVVGPWGSKGVPLGVRAIDGRYGIGSELAHADVVVTAGGVTLLEALRLGRPTVVVQTSENQRRYVEATDGAGAALWRRPEEVASAVASLMVGDQRRVLSATARRLVDGEGPTRVAQALLELL